MRRLSRHNRIRAMAAEMFHRSRKERNQMSESVKRNPPTPEQIRAAQKAAVERDYQEQQAKLPAIAPSKPLPAATPAIEGADAYLQHTALGMTPGRIAKFDGKEGKYAFIDDGTVLPKEAAYVIQSDSIWVGLRRFHGEGTPPSHAGGLIFREGFRIPARDELGHLDSDEWPPGKFSKRPEDPWRPAVYIPLEDRSSGEILTLIMSGPDGRSTQMIAANGLLAHCRNVQRRTPEKQPVVKLATGQYKNKRFGMLPKPVFEIVGLAPKEAVAVPDTSLAADLDDEIPF